MTSRPIHRIKRLTTQEGSFEQVEALEFAGALASIVFLVVSHRAARVVFFRIDIDGVFQGRGWTQAMVWCSAAMLVLCLWQHLSWLRATAVWHGRRNSDLVAVVAVSWILQLVSYAISVIALVVCVIALLEVGRFATTAVFLVLSLIALLAAQILAGVQHVRAEGPPGAVPAHLRVNG